MNTNKTVGYDPQQLDRVLTGPKFPQKVGYDPRDMQKLLGY